MSFRRSPLIHLALMFFLGLLVYSNTLTVPFVFDDIPNIQENPIVRNLSNIPAMFAGGTGPFASRPLMHATFALNYRFGGLDPTGYHAVNLALHLINGVLLYFLVVMTGRLLKYDKDGIARPAAFLASLIFVVHPVQTEAVTYVVSRSMLLATTFYLSGIMLFAKAATAERRWPYVAGLFVVSLLGAASREDFITFPLMLLLYDLFFISGFRAREAFGRWRLYLAVLPACAYLAYLALNNTYAHVETFVRRVPPGEYAITEFSVHWTYLRLMVLPIGQNLDYDYPVAKTLLELPTLFSFAGYLALLAGAIAFARRKHPAAFGVMWYLVALLPISFILALVGAVLGLRLAHVIFEHRLYLPSAGLIAGFAAGAVYAARELKFAWARKAVAICLVLLLALLSAAAYKRNHVWRGRISLWEDVVKKSPTNPGAQINLARAYIERGFIDKAIERYEMIIRIDPNYALAYEGLGTAYLRKGLLDKAIENYEITISIAPWHVRAYNNLGSAYAQKGLSDKAISYYERAIAVNPYYARSHINLGNIYLEKGLLDRAIERYEHALLLEPQNPAVHESLGAAYLRKGMEDEARMHFGIAESLRQGKGGP